MKKIILFCFLFITHYIFSQTQLGNDIQGVSAGDEFGTSVSLSADGSVLAIGAPLNDLTGSNGGLVRVYRFNNGTSTWEQEGNDILGESSNDQFGHSVSLSDDGSILAIGARFNGANNEGHVRVFTYNTNTTSWEQLGNDIDGTSNGDQSGHSVSLSSNGSILAIGSPFHSIDNGRVKVYSYNTNTTAWEQLGSEIITSSVVGGRFGYSVNLSTNGHTLAVGAISGGVGGMVEIYTYNTNTQVWEKKGSSIFGESSGDDSGYSVSLSSNGSTVAIGAPFNNGSGPSSGHVRIYQYNSGLGDWEQLGSDLDGEYSADDSGVSVSLSSDGSIVAVGARANGDGTPSFAGHVRIYQYNNTLQVWEQAGIDIDGASSSFSGSSVSLSSNGSIVAIGGPFIGGSLSSAGHVQVYGLANVLSINNPLFQKVNLYPNPSKNEIHIQLNDNILLKKISIYNQLGQLVKVSRTNITNIHELSSGLYFVEINTNQGKSTQKLIIK
ncbi:T9SS type A sorting domain-containing protein [Pseudotenacibaculum sp. MALMAid0570]|uniref:T9SS type A sorting domain-containing protein n=1 Tax=Pseudotenacibaculum sp. MALMAid0570 TaxID=3143938 RepID=UPI0032E03DF7